MKMIVKVISQSYKILEEKKEAAGMKMVDNNFSVSEKLLILIKVKNNNHGVGIDKVFKI